jgi:cytochrome c
MMKLMMMATFALTLAGPVAASVEVVKKARCVACHAVDKKMVGPSYREVAKRYEGQADAPLRLAEKVRSGGSGVWGSVPMLPHGADKISDENLKTAIEWILAGAPG